MLHGFLFMVFIFAAAFVLAKVEIHIEGGHGWAENLPTWRIENHPLLDLFFGGKPITGYHVWMLSFIFIIFHFPLFVDPGFDWYIEARIIAGLILFWIIEDFLWFVINPAYGLRKFSSKYISWHKRWWFGLPFEYLLYGIPALLLFYISYSFV